MSEKGNKLPPFIPVVILFCSAVITVSMAELSFGASVYASNT